MSKCRMCGHVTTKARWPRGHCPVCGAKKPPIPWAKPTRQEEA